MLLIYGFMFMALIAGCIAVSLGELASAYPNSGTSLPTPIAPFPAGPWFLANQDCATGSSERIELIVVGGQYYWASRLAPKKYARFLSYTTGYLGWAGAVVVSGSVAVGLAQAVVGMIILANPNVQLPPDTGVEAEAVGYVTPMADFCGIPGHQFHCLLVEHF